MTQQFTEELAREALEKMAGIPNSKEDPSLYKAFYKMYWGKVYPHIEANDEIGKSWVLFRQGFEADTPNKELGPAQLLGVIVIFYNNILPTLIDPKTLN